MSTLTTTAAALAPQAESYVDLLHSGPHWLFELTLEVLSAPLAFAAGRLWRNGVLRHVHCDLHAMHGAGLAASADRCPDLPTAGASPVMPDRRATALATAPSAPARPMPPLPVSLFSIPFGIAGLAGTWLYAAQLHFVPRAAGTALVITSATVWLLLMAGRARRWRSTSADLLDPTAGPFTALVLLTPLLVTVQGLGTVAPQVARLLFDVLTGLVVALAGWLTGQWMSVPLDLDRLHPGYLLPSVAGGYVASAGAAGLGQRSLAQVMFGLASVSWLVLGPLVRGRLMFRPALPPALRPTLAIEAAPPALATLAWLSLNGGRLDAVTFGLGGYGLLMALAQLRLLLVYRRLPVSPGFWAFTFPAAAVVTAALHWLALDAPPGRDLWSYLLIGALTALVAGVAIRSVLALRRGELVTPTTTARVDGAPEHAQAA